MKRTIKDATVHRFHYDSHDQLENHLNDFIHAYNFARRHLREYWHQQQIEID